MSSHLRTLAPLAALLALMAQETVRADEPDTLTFSARESVRYDSNLFRRSDNRLRSETQSTTVLGIAFDKRYSLQRLELDAAVAANRYRANDYLDFNALTYRGVWHWSLTPRLSGTLSSTRAEDINSFDYYRSFDRNVRTDHALRGHAEAELGRDWRLLGGLERERRTNERPTAEQGDYTLRNTSLGLRRLFPSDSSISYRILDGQGDYQNRIPGITSAPNAFNQREHELRLSWAATGKTTVGARLSHVQRQHPGLEVRDFSGTVGDVSLQWRATGKLGVQATLSRGIGSELSNTSSYSINERFALDPYWMVGPRTTLYAGYEHIRYAFGGALPGFADQDRKDRTNGAVLGVRWAPYQALSLSATVAHSRRTSTLEGFGYTNNSANVNARFSF